MKNKNCGIESMAKIKKKVRGNQQSKELKKKTRFAETSILFISICIFHLLFGPHTSLPTFMQPFYWAPGAGESIVSVSMGLLPRALVSSFWCGLAVKRTFFKT